MTIEDMKAAMLLIVTFSNLILRKKDSAKLERYRNLQITIIVLGFLYIVGIAMISLSNSNSFINTNHLVYLLILVFIVPLIDTILSSVIDYDIDKIKSIITKFSSILLLISLPCIIVIHFMFRNSELDKYSINVLLYIMIVSFIINDRKEGIDDKEKLIVSED